MTVYEKRKRKDRNKRIMWMIVDATNLCLMAVIIIGTAIILKGMM